MSAILPSSPARHQAPRLAGELRALWQLAWPILVGQLANVGMSVADVAMAGHASALDLAGISLGVSIWHIVIITLMGLMMSVSPMVSHLVGARQFDRVAHEVRQGLWKAAGVGLAAMLLANLAARIFHVMALDPPVRDMAIQFVLITSFGLPAFTGYRVLYGYSTSINQTKPLMVIALLALLLNVLINWLLVFGHWGFPRLGGLGCAWSTLLCVWFNFLGLLWWMHYAEAYRPTWPFGQWEAPHWPKLRGLMRLGLPIGITYFAETSAFSLIALLVARFGNQEVAAHQIALNFTSLVFMVPLSLGIALLTRVGQSLGAGNPAEARYRAWVGVGLAWVVALVSATGMALFNTQIAAAYTTDAGVAALAAQLLFLAAIFQLSDATQVVTSSAIRGYKIARVPMLIHLTAFWVVSLPLGYCLGVAPAWMPLRPEQPMGAQGFWIALIVGLTVAALGLLVLLHLTARSLLAEAHNKAH